MVHVPYDVIKHLLPPDQRRKVRKKEPCKICGELVCRCLEDEYHGSCRMQGLPVLRRQVQFHAERQWKCDFQFIGYPVMVEIDGGTHSQGRHTRGAGFEEDCRKLNEAAIAGYTVLRFTGAMVKSGEAVEQTERLLRRFGWNGV
jgi:very-short-patch-repair endonuclease